MVALEDMVEDVVEAASEGLATEGEGGGITKGEEVVAVVVVAASEAMATEGGGGATAKREAGDVEAAL